MEHASNYFDGKCQTAAAEEEEEEEGKQSASLWPLAGVKANEVSLRKQGQLRDATLNYPPSSQLFERQMWRKLSAGETPEVSR